MWQYYNLNIQTNMEVCEHLHEDTHNFFILKQYLKESITFSCALFDAVSIYTTQPQMMVWLMNDALESIWKKWLCPNQGTILTFASSEKSHEKPQSG
jgi:hypothetical protein